MRMIHTATMSGLTGQWPMWLEAANIRAAASEDSTIVGYLTTAASADVIERGETWSLVISGGVEGYVRE